jgi:hypothetical protein
MRCAIVDTWRSGNAWFICDRCSQRRRRSNMLTEWTNLKVCPVCIDPRPPQMTPPNVYPEGIPFFDARPPQDNPDRLDDNSYLRPVVGGVTIPNGGPPLQPNGQIMPEGGQVPKELEEDPTPYTEVLFFDDNDELIVSNKYDTFTVDDVGPTPPLPAIPLLPGQNEAIPANVLQDDITFKTGVIPAPTVPGAG